MRIRDERCEKAFEELMRRYSRLVYSVAWRRLGDPSLAEECVQVVFLRLARLKPRLTSEAEAVGWLHATAHRVTIDCWRKESRRRDREQRAAIMPIVNEPEDRYWDEVAPLLDEALNDLPSTDRQAILLRYFQCESLRDVGRALGLSEDAAKMRLRRALEKLQLILGKRGITGSAAALAVLLERNAAEAAVPGLIDAGMAKRIFSQAGDASKVTSLIGAGIILMKSKALVVLLMAALVCWWFGPHSDSPRRTASALKIAEFKGSTFFSKRGPHAFAKSSSDLDADRLAQLRDVLKNAPRVKVYPPNALVEALWDCRSVRTNAVAILQEALASADYETRHWAVAGLELISQGALNGAEELARIELARVAISTTEPDELRVRAMMSALGSSVGLEGQRASEPVSKEVVAILSSSFEAKGIEMANHNMMLADMLNQRLLASGQEYSDYAEHLQAILTSGDVNQQLGAAYALTGLPVEHPVEIKNALIQALEEDSPRSPTAMVARALGRLSLDAEDVLPALLSFRTKHPESGPMREETELAILALRPDLREQYPAAAKSLEPATEAAIVSNSSSLRQMILKPLMTELSDPERRKHFVLEDHWWGTPTWAVQPLRDAFNEAAAQSAPETAELLRKLADRIEPNLGTDEEASLELPSVGELLGRAYGVTQVPENNIPAGTAERVQALTEKYKPWWGVGSRKATADDLRKAAADIQSVNPKLYQATMKSFFEYHPELDRIFR